MRDIATTVLGGPGGLLIGLTTVVTACTALMIWLGLLGRASRATLLWTFAMLLTLLGSYGSLASAAMGTDVLKHPVGLGITCGAPLVIWSGLRAAQGKRPYAWAGFLQSLASVLILAFTTQLDVGYTVFRWLFLAAAVGAMVGAVEVMRGAFSGSRFGIPLVAASSILLLLGTVGVVGTISGSSAETDLLFIRGVVIAVIVYVICATVSVLFLANRREGASDLLEAVDAFMPVPMMQAVVREKLRRASRRHEQSWTFIDVRLDDVVDLREATGDASFATMVARFETAVIETMPAEADLCRVTPGHVLVFASQPSAAVREFVRAVLNEVSAPLADAPTTLRISASAGIVAVDTGADTFASLVVAARAAADEAQAEGGDRWKRVAARLATPA